MMTDRSADFQIGEGRAEPAGTRSTRVQKIIYSHRHQEVNSQEQEPSSASLETQEDALQILSLLERRRMIRRMAGRFHLRKFTS